MSRRKMEELFNHHIGVQLGETPDQKATELARQLDPNALPIMQEFWYVIFTDRDTGDVIRVGLTRKGRDGLVRDLTGGIVLAGGELPKI